MSFGKFKLITALMIIVLSFGIIGCGQVENSKNTFDKSKINIDKLLEYKNSYIGDNTAIGSIISNLPASIYNDRFELQTASKPYGITIKYKDFKNADFKLEDDTGISLPFADVMKKNAMIIFSLVKNVDVVNFNIIENGVTITYEKNELVDAYKAEYGENLENITKDKLSLENFIENDIKE